MCYQNCSQSAKVGSEVSTTGKTFHRQGTVLATFDIPTEVKLYAFDDHAQLSNETVP